MPVFHQGIVKAALLTFASMGACNALAAIAAGDPTPNSNAIPPLASCLSIPSPNSDAPSYEVTVSRADQDSVFTVQIDVALRDKTTTSSATAKGTIGDDLLALTFDGGALEAKGSSATGEFVGSLTLGNETVDLTCMVPNQNPPSKG